MNRIPVLLLAWLSLCLAFPLSAAEPRQQPTPREDARTVKIFHQPIVMLQATFGQTTPEERVLRIRNILRDFTEADISQPLQVVPVTRYNQPGRLFLMNGKPVMMLSQADLDEGDDLTLDQAAQRVLARMEAQRHSLREQYNKTYLALAIVKVVVSTLVLAAIYYAAWRSWRRVRRFFHLRILEKRSWIPQGWRRFLGNIETKLYALLMILLGILALYAWLSWAFGLFPWTRVWSESLGDWSVGVLQEIALSIASALPGLIIVLIILLITWFIIRLVKLLLSQVEAGRLHIPGLHPETVGATRKLISVMIWLFALSAAYPFLPGANSLAFKGISVFFGLMLTLGSAGVMNHAMSGLVLIYSRALHKGDVIRIADNEGKVSEIGMLATKIITRENYVVTVPNAVVVSGKITNLSVPNNDTDGNGVNLTTGVTIGYDTPWRQVQAMLELAAHRASGIDHRQPPLVRQLGLMDWYVSYELQVRLLEDTSLSDGRNALHSNIQDVFNEFGVQIMSPNFVMQPKGSVVVAKEDWYAAPALAPQQDDVKSV
ncbi:mechanosensitive ion channel family protein [Klebsiella sp. B345]|uniref:mechanosensitive ion channel family protein n=1 Tax=Klebsiella sp. B345 TaxID=2755398 RepID=UPI003DA97EF5